MAKKIQGRFIIQIAGKPVENVEKALNIVNKQIKEKPDEFEYVESYIEEAKYDEESTLYTSFIDTILKFNTIIDLLHFIIDYTPNSIEIEEPSEIKISKHDLAEFLNESSSKFLILNTQIRHLNAHIHNMNTKNK